MRCCFVANSSWYLSNFRSSTIEEFSSFCDVSCLSPPGGEEFSLSYLGVREKAIYLDSGGVNPMKELMSLLSILINISRVRPDVVFSFNPKTNLYCLIACWLLRIPCVPNVSGVGAASNLGGLLGKVYGCLVRRFYKSAYYVFFQNQSDFDIYSSLGCVTETEAEVLPGSGVDLARFTPHGEKPGKMRFLMAARLIKPKGVEEYLEAARKLLAAGANCEFLLAGVKDFSSRAVSCSIVKEIESESNIHFLGHVLDMPNLLNSVDCVVLPSYYPEGVPRSLIEAAAAGKIIITTNRPGCNDVVTHGCNGYLIEAQSIESLVQSMQAVIELPKEKVLEMKKASRLLAENKFDENLVIRRYVEIANGVCGLA